MVCMDDVFDWFNHLEGHKRIEFICGLLPMCHPLELRYIGSYLEDLAKKDFFILREAELKWNSIQHLCRLVDLSDPYTRSKIITAFALLHSYNTECANQLFLILQSNMQNKAILQSLANMDAAAMQTLLLLTMAVNHPAFTLMQRQEIRDMLDEVIKETGVDNQDEEEVHCDGDVMTGLDSTFLCHESPQNKIRSSPQSCVRVVLTGISVTSSRRREDDRKVEFQLQVHWSNGITIDMCKTFDELQDFHKKLIHLFPDEAGAHRQDRQIPYLHKQTDEIAKLSVNVTNYMNQMLSVPLKIQDSDHVRQFFCDPTFSAQSSRASPTTSQRTHSSLDSAPNNRCNSLLEGSVQRLNASFDTPDSEPNRRDDIELRPSFGTTDLRRSSDSVTDVNRAYIQGMVGQDFNGLRTSIDSLDSLKAGSERQSSVGSSPRKVDGDTQTEGEFLEPELQEGERYPDEVVDETDGEECDITVVVPPISIPDSPPPPPLHCMGPPAPPLPRLPANMALVDPMAGLSLHPVPGCLVATSYPQTVMTGGTETSTTNRYAYSSNTVAPSPHSSPLPSPLISPRVVCTSMTAGGPAVSAVMAGAPNHRAPVLVNQGSVAPPPPHHHHHHHHTTIHTQNQQPRYQPYDSPRFHHPPPPQEQPHYDPSRYDSNRQPDRQSDSPRYSDARYNGPPQNPAKPERGFYQQQNPTPGHHYPQPPQPEPQTRYPQYEPPTRYHHHHDTTRFRDAGRYRSDSPRSNRSRNPSQDSQRGRHHHHHHPPETIAEWLKMLRLHKYSEQLSKYSVEQLMNLTEEDLENEGLTKGARKKLLSQIDKCREESRLLNGDVAWYGPLYPLSIVTAKHNHNRYQSGGSSSVDSSASYSDCSSPCRSPLTTRKDSVTSDAEYDKDSEVSGSVRSYPSPSQPPPPKLSTHDDSKPSLLDQSSHFKPLPVHGQYADSPTSSPGPPLIYQTVMPGLDHKYIIERQPPQPPHQHQHFLDKGHQYHHSSIPFNPNQPPPSTSTPPSGCSQCGCNGDCTAHPPPPLPYPVRFLTPTAQLGVFPPAFLTGGNGNGLVSPVFHQHILPNGVSPELLYPTQHNTFFLATAGHNQSSVLAGQGHHAMMPPVLTAGNGGGPYLPVPVSSPMPSTQVTSSANGAVKHGPKFTCYNCGQVGHKAAECKEATMEAMTHNGQFHLRYAPRTDDDR